MLLIVLHALFLQSNVLQTQAGASCAEGSSTPSMNNPNHGAPWNGFNALKTASIDPVPGTP